VTAAGVVLAGLLAGCGGAGSASVTAAGDAAEVAATTTPVSPSAAAVSSEAAGAASEAPAPSLPPGDPGLDAPAVPDPGAAPVEEEAHGEPRRRIPAAALLTPATVQTVAGGGWRQHPGGGDECLSPSGSLGARSMSYGGSDAGLVVETVATYRDARAADRAVKTLAAQAEQCGWTGIGDPRLGSASAAGTDAERSMVAVSAEGVVVLLVGTGPVTAEGTWASLVDLALGSSCPAAPDGCH
jgi:hypothetical protein